MNKKKKTMTTNSQSAKWCDEIGREKQQQKQKQKWRNNATKENAG
jgi:hypothetical protein